MTLEPTFHLHRGTQPLLVSMPHAGTAIPPEVREQLTTVADLLQDTDWHMERLYGFAEALGASVLRPVLSRYAIDLNRPPGGESLYPGQTTTGLLPGETFRGEPLYPAGHLPGAAERARRLVHYWQPYHDALQGELARLRAEHGAVLLWDAHSIASELPRLFEGRLPDLNFGTNGGASCEPRIVQAVLDAARRHPFTQVLDGRFKGGYITRHYGAPAHGIHAIQLEMCQCLYMDERAPFDYLPARAVMVQVALREMLGAAVGVLRGLGAR